VIEFFSFLKYASEDDIDSSRYQAKRFQTRIFDRSCVRQQKVQSPQWQSTLSCHVTLLSANKQAGYMTSRDHSMRVSSLQMNIKLPVRKLD
jgi:hypothetical protein